MSQEPTITEAEMLTELKKYTREKQVLITDEQFQWINFAREKMSPPLGWAEIVNMIKDKWGMDVVTNTLLSRYKTYRQVKGL